MAQQKILVTIPLEGPISAEALGYEGPACSLDMKAVLDALGGQVEKESKKPEYFRRAKVRERERA